MTTLTYTEPLHRRVLRTLVEAGFEAYFVGGFVRDSLLGKESKDVDVTTAATPEQLAALFPEFQMVGAKFGVGLVKDEGETVEVATFRVDGVYTDNRRPSSVSFTTDVRKDVARRDFTMNALLQDLDGNVVDHVNGLIDLRNGFVRTVGDPAHRFAEDALRMLRAVRFAAKLDFLIEPLTMTAIQANAATIRTTHPNRVRQELDRILTSGNAAYGVELLLRTGLLGWVLPEVEAMVGVAQNPKHHPEGDVFTHTLGLLRGLEKGCSITLALAALLHDVGKPTTFELRDFQPTFYGHEGEGAIIAAKILRRLHYPTAVIEIVVRHVLNHMRFRAIEEMRRSKLLRFMQEPNFSELLALHKLDAAAGLGNMKHAEFVERIMAEVPEATNPQPRLLTGEDLIAMGLKPGPQFRRVLDAVETEHLDGRLMDKESALAWVAGVVEGDGSLALAG